jgi:hypothetical protein
MFCSDSLRQVIDALPSYIEIGQIPSVLDDDWGFIRPSIELIEVKIDLSLMDEGEPCFAIVPYDNQKTQEQKSVRRNRRRVR